MNYTLACIQTNSEFYSGVLSLREKILRHPIGLILSKEDIAEDAQQFILITHQHQVVIGCLMAKPLNDQTVKFRQMAVDPSFQKTGIGSDLIKFAERICMERNYRFIELNARVEAIPFYLKNNYLLQGDEFLEVGIPHKKMYKSL